MPAFTPPSLVDEFVPPSVDDEFVPPTVDQVDPIQDAEDHLDDLPASSEQLAAQNYSRSAAADEPLRQFSGLSSKDWQAAKAQAVIDANTPNDTNIQTPLGAAAYSLVNNLPAAVPRGGKALLAGMSDLASTATGNPTTESLSQFANNPQQPLPAEVGAAEMSGLSSVPTKAAVGLVKAVPAIGASLGLGLAGAPAFMAAGAPMMFDEKGKLDPVGMGVAMGLPGVAKAGTALTSKLIARIPAFAQLELNNLTGQIKGAIVQKLGGVQFSSDTLRKFMEQGGGMVAANAYLAAAKAPEIMALPPDQRKAAILDTMAANLGPSLLAFSSRPGEWSESLKEIVADHPEWAGRMREMGQTLSEQFSKRQSSGRVPSQSQPAEEGAPVPQHDIINNDVISQPPATVPVPEPDSYLRAQADATLDPENPKAVTLVTPGATLPHDNGLVPVMTNQGVALVNPEKVDPSEAVKQINAGGGGQLIGMSTDAKPDGATHVLQTKTADGTVIQEEVVTPQTLPAAVHAGQAIAPGGTQEVKSLEQGLAERVALNADKVPEEVQSAAGQWRQAEKDLRRALRQDPPKVDDAREARDDAELDFRKLAEKHDISQQQFEHLQAYAKETETQRKPVDKSSPSVTAHPWALPDDQLAGYIKNNFSQYESQGYQNVEKARAIKMAVENPNLAREGLKYLAMQTGDLKGIKVETLMHGMMMAHNSGSLMKAYESSHQFVADKIATNEKKVAELSLVKKPKKDVKDALWLAQQHVAQYTRQLAEVKASMATLEGIESGVAENKVHGFGARAPRSSPPGRQAIAAGVPPAVAASPAVPMGPVGQWFANRTLGFRGLFAPASIDQGARDVANILRERMGEAALNLDRAEAAMHALRNEFDRTPAPRGWKFVAGQPLPHNFAVIDALERDRPSLPQRYQDFARYFDQAFQERIAVIQRYAPRALQNLIQDYFPHIWQDPKRAQDVMAQISTRLFAGRKEFVKQRSIPIFAEGLERGLVPISDNPVDLLLAKLHSMDKFIAALKAIAEFKSIGQFKFKYLFERMEPGWQTVDDPSFIVQKPPVVTVREAYDAYQRAALGDLLTHLGVSYQRVASLGGSRWAQASSGTREITAQIGATEDILWHEAGHHLDFQFADLRSAFQFKGNTPAAQQLRALVDMNHPGIPHNPAKHYHTYLRRSEEKIAETVRAYVHAPKLLQSVAPIVWQSFNGWLDMHPDIRAKLDAIRPGLEIGSEETDIKLGGMQVLGHWIMPDGPAQVIKNYLSPGLGQYAIYRSLRTASNVLNGAQLGFSAFHLGFTSLDAATSAMALGIKQAVEGTPLAAIRTLAEVPISPVSNLVTGARLKAEALHPGTHPEMAALVRALEQAGGRVGNDRMYRTEFTRRMIRAWHEGGRQWATLPIRFPLAVLEQFMRPILDYIVPRQKLGVFARMAQYELTKLGPNATAIDTRAALQRAWDSVDNRMGQVVYDNLFYNRIVKDIALMSFRAYGWQLGKYREGLGALSDTAQAAADAARLRKPEITHRMSYAMALPLMVGAIGALLGYLMTGKRPENARDCFQPQTGETDRNGNPVRLNEPSYIKDIIAYGKHPVTSVAHSLNPAFASMFDLLQNKNFYNVQIRNPDDPLWQQGSAVALFAGKELAPFALTGIQQMRQNDSPAWKSAAPFFGFTPVPQRLTMTPAQELASELMANGADVQTQEQFDRKKVITDAVAQIKKGNPSAGLSALASGLQSETLNPNAMQVMIDRLKYNPLQFQVSHLTPAAAIRVWNIATDDEKASLKPILAAKIANAKTMWPTDKAKMLQNLK